VAVPVWEIRIFDRGKDSTVMDQRESVRARHAAELEAKRKKLEEIRRRKANIRYVSMRGLAALSGS
jgi:hypothetical protein